MRITVCVERVPDLLDPIDIKGGELHLPEGTEYVVNPCDEVAVEEAVRIKERLAGQAVQVYLVSAGPPDAESALRRCLALGADYAIHVCDQRIDKSNGYARARILSAVISSLHCQLVLCGGISLYGNSGQLGATVAELLNSPFLSGVTRLELLLDSGVARVHRRVEGGYREVINCQLPAVLAVEIGLNKPRYAALPDLLRAKRQNIRRCSLDQLGIDLEAVAHYGSKAKVLGYSLPKPRPRVFTPDDDLPASERIRLLLTGGIKKRRGDFLDGPPDQIAAQVMKFLNDNKLL